MTMILHETLPLALEQPGACAGVGPSIRLSARPRMLRLRRHFPRSTGSRTWLLELEVDVPEIDPERLLAACDGFLVDDREGRQIGVVVRVERSEPTGAVAALLVSVPAGWFRQRYVRIDERAITALVPQQRLVIVDETQLTPVGNDSQR
jgi:hypothetical protein